MVVVEEVNPDPDTLVEPDVATPAVPVGPAFAPPKTPNPYNNPKIKAKRAKTPNNGHNQAGHPPFLAFLSTTEVVTTGLWTLTCSISLTSTYALETLTCSLIGWDVIVWISTGLWWTSEAW